MENRHCGKCETITKHIVIKKKEPDTITLKCVGICNKCGNQTTYYIPKGGEKNEALGKS